MKDSPERPSLGCFGLCQIAARGLYLWHGLKTKREAGGGGRAVSYDKSLAHARHDHSHDDTCICKQSFSALLFVIVQLTAIL